MTDSNSQASPRKRRRSIAIAVSTVAILAAGAGVGWAGSVVFEPVTVVEENAFTFVNVGVHTVGSALTLNAVAEWMPTPMGGNLATGTVTSIDITSGQEVGAGTPLYSVNLRPTVVGQGTIPAFQSLQRGSVGADVKQLQQFLSTLGFYVGDIDGSFGAGTESAVKQWQKAAGVTVDGVVQPGDIFYVPSLPLRVAIDSAVLAVGLVLSGGEKALLSLSAAPEFLVPISTSQSSMIPLASRVSIEAPDGTRWDGEVLEQRADEQQALFLLLGRADGTQMCGEACNLVPVGERLVLRAEIVTAESISGPALPTAALESRPDGSIIVTDETGTEIAVEILQTAEGMSAVSGVQAGTLVRVPRE